MFNNTHFVDQSNVELFLEFSGNIGTLCYLDYCRDVKYILFKNEQRNILIFNNNYYLNKLFMKYDKVIMRSI